MEIIFMHLLYVSAKLKFISKIHMENVSVFNVIKMIQLLKTVTTHF